MNEKVKVPDVRTGATDGKGSEVRALSTTPRSQEDPRSRPPLARPSQVEARGGLHPAIEAWAKIAGPLRRRKGIRVLFFGVTTKGKTHGVVDLLEYIVMRHLVDVIMVHDVKKPTAQYNLGAPIHESHELTTNPPEAYPAVRVLRKRDIDHMPSVDAAARTALESGYLGVTSMLVVDEFSRALTDGGKWDAPNAERIWCEGADFGVSGIGTKQLPQYTPTTAMAQSDLVIFGQNGKGASYFVDEDYIPAVAGDLVARLDQRHFILVPQEGDFDGNVYEVPLR